MAAIVHATTVLPTPVSVPVTNSPETERLGYAARAWSNRIAERCACAAWVAPASPYGRANLRRGPLELARVVARHCRQAQPRAALRHGRGPDRLREHSPLQRSLAHGHGSCGVAHDQRHDRALTGWDREPLVAERVTQRLGIAAHALDPAGVLAHQVERGQCRGDDRRRGPGGEDQRARDVHEVSGHLRVAAGVGAVGAERLAEGPDDDVHLALEAGFGDGSTPFRPEDAGRVCLVDHHPRVVAACEVHDAARAAQCRRPSRTRCRSRSGCPGRPPRAGPTRGGRCRGGRRRTCRLAPAGTRR